MDEELRLKRARAVFLESVSAVIDERFTDAKQKHIPISDGKILEGHLSVASLFDHVIIDASIIKLIAHEVDRIKSIGNCGEVSLGQLIREAKKIGYAQRWLRKIESKLKAQLLDVHLDYVKEINNCLEIIRGRVKQSKENSRSTDYKLASFCVFCWRLVDKIKDKSQSYNDGKDHSSFYCLVHHPKYADWNYHNTKAKLFHAINEKGGELSDELKRRNIEKTIRPCFLYKLTSSLTKKPSYSEICKLFGVVGENSSIDTISRIRKIAMEFYPNASKEIETIRVNKKLSLQDWFYAVINKLDPSGNDSKNWNFEDFNMAKIECGIALLDPYIVEGIMLNILRRYESAQIINKVSITKGPKPGTVPKNDDLRSRVVVLANECLEKNNKLNGSEIARVLNVTSSRINNLLKELGYR